MNRTSKRLLLFSAALGLAVSGQLAAKAGALRAAGGDHLNPLLALSLLCLFVRGLLWAAVLRRERLVFAYPVMALAYPLLLPFTRLFFGEAVTPARMAGSLLVVAGVTVMALAEVRS